MISILIPTFNYSIQDLVQGLLSQLNSVAVNWEIVIRDDASDEKFQIENVDFIDSLQLDKVAYIISDTNEGAAVNRNLLVEKAKYDWLLFLDADVLPVHDDFIPKYIEAIEQVEADVFLGNVKYQENIDARKSLRYVYGRKFEEEQLGKNHFSGTTANFAVRNIVAKNHPFLEALPNNYGHEDSFFFASINDYKKQSIDNPVYHINWDDNKTYLSKVKQSIENLEYLNRHHPEDVSSIRLLLISEKFPIITQLLGKLYLKIKKPIEKNLLGNRPSAQLLQLYKWSYFGYLQAAKYRF